MFDTNLGRHKSSSPASTRPQPSGTFSPAGCRGREGRARVDCEDLLGSRRYGSVERFQALLQAFAEAFALPLTADVIDNPDSSFTFQHVSRSAVDAAARAGRVVSLGNSDDARNVGWWLRYDGGRCET